MQVMGMGERGRRVSPPALAVSLLSLLLTGFPYRIAKGTGTDDLLLQIMQEVYCASVSIRIAFVPQTIDLLPWHLRAASQTIFNSSRYFSFLPEQPQYL